MTTQIKQEDINRAVWGACDTLRGTVSPDIYKDYVLTMLFLKYISDVWQDHYDGYKKQHGDHPELITELLKSERFVLPKGASFYSLYDRRHEPGNGERIDKALHAIEEANISKLRDVFQDISFNSNRLGEEKQKNDLLRHLLEDFSKPELNLRPSRIGKLDVIGNAYEFLIKNFASDAGRKAGEFYTPPEVSELISELVAPKEGDEICDPTCGSGSLLMKCGKQVQANFNGSKKYALYGQEAIGSTWALAKMNMFLHGEDNHRIEWGDTIRNPKLLDGDDRLQHFDVVVANPPFSLEKWGHDTAEADKYGRFRRNLPPKTKGDYAFILHMLAIARPGEGRVAVVAPHGVLFRGGAEGRIRESMVRDSLLDAVVGLPAQLFPTTGIPVCILVFDRARESGGRRDHERDVLFIDASRDFEPGKKQNRLGEADVSRIVRVYRERREEERYSHRAAFDEMERNGFNLNIPRYVDTFEPEPEIDLQAVQNEIRDLERQLAETREQMNRYLAELGIDV